MENLVLQKKLEEKLADASNDLGTLTSALGKIKDKAEKFSKNKQDVQLTINQIKEQLTKLKGKSEDAKAASDSTSLDTAVEDAESVKRR